MKWILITMQAFVMMFCFVYGTNAKAEGPVPEVTEKDPQVTILLERMYVDGEVSEEIFTEKRDCPNKCSLFETSVIFLRKLSIQSEKIC